MATNKANSTNKIITKFSSLNSTIGTLSAGDTVSFANGTYLYNSLTITASNITIMALNPGMVYLNGYVNIKLNGNNVTFSGFQFTAGTTDGSAITVNGNNNTLSHLNFNGYNASHMIIIYGQYNVVTRCNFQNKPATNFVSQGGTGDLVQIIPITNTPGYNVIRYCSFQHIPGYGGDYGNECIRLGLSTYSTYVSRTIVEYCYFEDTGDGDSEAISVKCKENCIRYNTMNNNPKAMFCFRNGDDNVAYGNFFIKSGGIRCKQSNNIYCYNNYFEQTYSSSSPAVYLEYYDNLSDSNFSFFHNTFYKGSPIIINTGMKNCTWANNIFYSDSTTVFSGTTSGQIFVGNIYRGTLGLTISSGMRSIEPLLSLNANGYYSLSATSPAINAASASYPSLLDITGIDDDPTFALDISGLSRPSTATLKDVGANEYTTGTITNRPLTLADVGPTYLTTTSVDSCICH